MFQVLNLPYLLQSLVPTKGAICVQPRPRGTVHHYPSHCKSRDRSSTAGSARTEYQCAPKNNASYEVSQCDTRNDAGNASYEVSQCDTRNNAGYGVAQCAARNDAGYGGMQRAAIAVKQEPVYGVPQCAANPTDAGRYGVGTGIPVQSIKTEGCQTHYSPCPRDNYNSQQIRYFVEFQVENLQLKSRPSPSVSRTAMSPDTDSLFASGPLPLSPLALSNQNSPSSYYSASDADFATLYDLPAQPPFNSSSLELYSGSNEDINSPVFSKMVDPSGGTCELLSLSDISNSALGYDDYLCSGVNNGLDQDWLVEPVSLPSPEEQDTDVKLPLVPPPATPQTLSFQFWPTPPVTSSSPALLTPDPSLPGSPSSTHSYSSEEEEVKEVLSFFDDGESNRDVVAAAVQPFAPNMVMLPVISPPQILDVHSPTSSCPLLSPSPSLQDSEDSCDGLLDRRESSASLPSLMPSPTAHMENGNMEKSRKRKSLSISSSDKQSCAPSPAVKRRLSKSVKKERKKEQNKTAALRYRQKKKEEKGGIELKRIELEEKNQDLKAQVNSLSNEINYLKKLWSEVCANKKQSEVSKLS